MRKLEIPKIGMRIIKSAIALFICLVISSMRPNSIPTYAALAALIAMQNLDKDSIKIGIDRMQGTIIGGVYGLFALLILQKMGVMHHIILTYFIISLMLILLFYITVLIKKSDASYMSSVVFLSIVLAQNTMSPVDFAFNRTLDTLIGVIVGILVNGVWIPWFTNKNLLFICGYDGVLAGENSFLSKYVIVRLNRLLEKGAAITLATRRTPATILPRIKDVNFTLPIIVMNGAALYNPVTREFLYDAHLSSSLGQQISKCCRLTNIQCYKYAIVHSELHVFCEEPNSDKARERFYKLQTRQYQSFVVGELPEGIKPLFLFCEGKTEDITKLLARLKLLPDIKKAKIMQTEDPLQDGYSNLEIINATADKGHAANILKEKYQFDDMVAIGNVEEDIPLLKTADIAFAMSKSDIALGVLNLPILTSNEGESAVKKVHELFYKKNYKKYIKKSKM